MTTLLLRSCCRSFQVGRANKKVRVIGRFRCAVHLHQGIHLKHPQCDWLKQRLFPELMLVNGQQLSQLQL